MMKTLISLSLLLLAGLYLPKSAAAIPFPHSVAPTDSIGIEKKDGKRYVLHRVDEGQTLYGVARRYGRSVDEIRAANPGMDDALRYAQVVRVPMPDESLSRKEAKNLDKNIREDEKMKKREATTDVTNRTAGSTTSDVKPEKPAPVVKKQKDANDPARAGIHVVAAGQTLYSLAVRYGVSQEDLRKWNGLSSNNILIGQALIVSERASQDREPSTPTPAPTPDPKATRPADHAKPDAPVRSGEPARPPERVETTARPTDRTEPDAPAPKPDSPTTATRATEPSKPASADRPEPEIPLPSPGNDAPMPTRGRRQSSSGVAEMIENDNSGKYLAMHRTAPIGTLIQVRNLFNNQSMWVKVVGQLPDTGVNDKILIKLSSQAFAKLSPQDRRFRAEVSYITR